MIFSTLLLNKNSWDLSIDALGNIAMDSTSYAVAQDVASAVKTIQGELYYDTSQGIPYPTLVWGKNYVPQLVQSLIEAAAKSVPGVVQTQATLELSTSRQLTGAVRIINENGQTLNAHF